MQIGLSSCVGRGQGLIFTSFRAGKVKGNLEGMPAGMDLSLKDRRSGGNALASLLKLWPYIAIAVLLALLAATNLKKSEKSAPSNVIVRNTLLVSTHFRSSRETPALVRSMLVCMSHISCRQRS